MIEDDLESIRRKKMLKWEKNYSFKTNSSCNIENPELDQKFSVAGRIVFFRDLGRIVFLKLRDFSGTIQVSFSEKHLTNFNFLKSNLDLGDIIGISGFIYKTTAGEFTLQAEDVTPLRKALNPLPDKWKGLQDTELKLRYRYVDIISDETTKEIFKTRFKIIASIKKFLLNKDFIEVETPILQPIASGAAANPFTTHHDALDINLYLRIAPELYLKRLLVAGFNKVFEMGKCFRNEGIDPTHLQEFTMLEFYQAFISYEDLQNLAIELIQEIVRNISPNLIINDMDFNNIPKISYIDFLQKYGNIDFNKMSEETYIEEVAKLNNIDLNDCPSFQAVLDKIYKHCCVKKITSPILVYNYPKSPLAKEHDPDSRFSEQFQIILQKQEIIKSCLEMNDPDIQKANFEQQKEVQKQGDKDVVRTDDDFIKALQFGMPPAGGLGLGIDRLTTLLTQTDSIRNVVFFPTTRTKLD